MALTSITKKGLQPIINHFMVIQKRLFFVKFSSFPKLVEKYNKNDGGLFKITLRAYLQGGRKNHPQRPHFGEVLGAKILPKSIKHGFEIVTKIISIFRQIF